MKARISPTRLAIGLVALIATGVAAAKAAEPLPPVTAEPITPIPDAAGTAGPIARLGGTLFGEPLLSGAADRSCSSCHDVASNGASSRRFDLSPDGRLFARNTPSVFNSALNWRQDWTGDAANLEEQADRSLRDPALMNADPAVSVGRLKRSAGVRRQFQAAFGRVPDWPGIIEALAAYERTLVTPDSRFDRWLSGRGTLTAEELTGYEEFKSIGCTACHQGVNVGGNLLERAGVVQPMGRPGSTLYKVPSLRNVAVTAPYFDDASAPTLESAVHRMGTAQLGRDLPATDVAAIAAFLRSLTGRYHGVSLHAADR
jgi:cytochrome c peroxidase